MAWTVEIRIPVTPDGNDPLNQVVGRKPSVSLPWHFNVCRQRIRDDGSEYSALSPTGKPAFHVRRKFAHFYAGRSNRFEVDPTVTDYLLQRRAASALASKRRHAEAIEAFTALAERDVTEFQKSDALELAAASARALRRFDQAETLARRIPNHAVAAVVRMKNLLATGKAGELLEAWSDEEIQKWPFWKVGEGCVLRGRAYAAVGRGREAEVDLTRAQPFTTDLRARMELWLALATNREDNLEDRAAALNAYLKIAGASRNTGSATYYRGILGAARIHRQGGRIEEALAVLRRVEIAKLRGYWHGALQLALGDTLMAAARKREALEAYRAVLKDEGASAAHKKAARKALGERP